MPNPKRGKIPSSTRRGYGYQHKQTRKAVAARLPLPCARGCGELVTPDQEWHLDHNDSRAGYIGASHAWCNRSAGGKKAQGNRRDPPPRPTTRW